MAVISLEHALLDGDRAAALIGADVLGFLIWGDVPAEKVFAGAALIFMAGMIIIDGERFGRRLRPT